MGIKLKTHPKKRKEKKRRREKEEEEENKDMDFHELNFDMVYDSVEL